MPPLPDKVGCYWVTYQHGGGRMVVFFEGLVCDDGSGPNTCPVQIIGDDRVYAIAEFSDWEWIGDGTEKRKEEERK